MDFCACILQLPSLRALFQTGLCLFKPDCEFEWARMGKVFHGCSALLSLLLMLVVVLARPLFVCVCVCVCAGFAPSMHRDTHACI